jgi:hypothetical protein
MEKVKFFLALIILFFAVACGRNSETDEAAAIDIAIEIASPINEEIFVEETAAEIPVRDYSVVGIILPENPTAWQIAYADFFYDSFRAEDDPSAAQGRFWWEETMWGFYVSDINGNGIPEVFLQYSTWNYPTNVLRYANGEIIADEIFYPTSTANYFLFLLPETGDLLVNYTGHTTGTAGTVYYSFYENTSDGFARGTYIWGNPDSDFFTLNHADVTREEFFAAIETHVTPFERIDFADLMFTGHLEERLAYLNSTLFN